MTTAQPPSPPASPPPGAPPPGPPYLPPVPPYAAPPPAAPPPMPPVRGQLRRSRDDKIIGGVCGGLARYSGIDALLWRVGFVALTLAGGTGIVVYLLLWLLMPADAAPAGAGADVAARAGGPVGPRSPVPGLTIAALLIVLGALALVGRYSPWDPGARTFLGAALLVVGLGLVAAAFAGGRSGRGGLIALGVVLSVALLVASAAPWQGISGGVGDRTFVPATADDVRPVYRSGVGDVRLDLSAVDVSDLDAPIRTRLDHGVGDTTVIVPFDADVQVFVDSGVGNVDVFDGAPGDGGLTAGEGTGSWIDDGEPEIVLTIEHGIGDVEVSRG